jgi:hypothetical protein
LGGYALYKKAYTIMNSVDFFSKYLLEKLGDKFWIATLIPSISLVGAAAIVFDPLLNISSSFATQNTFNDYMSTLLVVVIIPSGIIAFVLYALQPYILQFYEGYAFVHRLSFLRNAQIIKAKKLLAKINALNNQIGKLERKNEKTDGLDAKVGDLKSQYYELAAEYDQSFPYSTELILPTRLGNILRASETYPSARYGMDAVSWWPRLYDLLPRETKQAYQSALNELYIFLNFSFLSVIFFILCLFSISYTVFDPIATKAVINSELIFRYTYAGLIAAVFSRFFYRLSLFKAGAFGNQIRSAYDLYRLQLLEQMRIKLPDDSADEFYIWKNLGEFIVLRDFSLDFRPFSYIWTQKKQKRSRPASIRE